MVGLPPYTASRVEIFHSRTVLALSRGVSMLFGECSPFIMLDGRLGWGPRQPDLVGGDSIHGRGVGTERALRPLAT